MKDLVPAEYIDPEKDSGGKMKRKPQERPAAADIDGIGDRFEPDTRIEAFHYERDTEREPCATPSISV